jgi:hypothetical protein
LHHAYLISDVSDHRLDETGERAWHCLSSVNLQLAKKDTQSSDSTGDERCGSFYIGELANTLDENIEGFHGLGLDGSDDVPGSESGACVLDLVEVFEALKDIMFVP